MALILNSPVELVARLFGDWLTLSQLSRLEVAMCSDDCRLGLLAIFERVVLNAIVDNAKGEYGQQMLDWLVTRKVRVCSLQLLRPLPKSAGTKLTALLGHSKQHILTLNVHSDACALGPLVACIPRFCPQIADLDMRNFKLNRLFFEVLSGMNHLKKLRLTDCTEISPEYCNELSCSSVDHLRLDGKYSAPVQRAMISMCPNLVMCGVFRADDVDLSTLPSTATKINVFRCAQLVAWKLNSGMSNVRVFSTRLTDEQAAEVITQCPNLQFIDIGFNRSILETRILSFCDTYKGGLLGLEIPACGNITLAGLTNALSVCNNLQSLDISHLSPAITQNCLFVTIAQNCRALLYLGITKNTVSDDALITISHMPIETLFMKSTKGYTERGLVALITGCISLEKIAINNILVTSSSLVQSLWKTMHPSLELFAEKRNLGEAIVVSVTENIEL